MAGALGNCYDRLRFGFVRDFMHFHVDSIGLNIAIFNFADMAIVCGVVGVAVRLLTQPVDEHTPAANGERVSVSEPDGEGERT